MQLLGSLAFWCAALALFAAGQLLPPRLMQARAGAIAAISAPAVALLFGLDLRQLALLALAIVWVLGALVLVRPDPRRSQLRLALLLIAPILAAWTIGKIATATNQPLGWLFFVGASFFLVKAFSLIKDRLEGKVKRVDPLVGAAYFLFLPTYLSGPMHTYGEFEATLAEPAAIEGEVVDVAFRFVWGLFKVAVLAPIGDRASLTQLTTAVSIPAGELALAAIVYSFVLYFNFSGYTDIVIALSRLMRVRTPENFDWPYLAPSIRDFWRRWHMTFTRALTAHVFIPISRALSRSVIGHNRFLTPAIGYLVTFVFAGFWHGATPNFLLWGAWHAVGLIAQDIWQKLRGPKLGAKQPFAARWATRSVCTGATFLYVSFGWVFFVLPIQELTRITWTLP